MDVPQAMRVDCETGECVLEPLTKAELAVDRGGPSLEVGRELAPPAGIVGWPCRELVGATCVHPGCRPAEVTAAAEAQAAALDSVAVPG